MGNRVHLFVSSPSDMTAVRDVWERLDVATRTGCTIVQSETPDTLLDFFRGLDVIISSRLHGVLLAIVSARPVLALSHERKVKAVMHDAGVGDFCVDLTTATLEQVTGMLWRLTERQDSCAQLLREYAESANCAVRHQDDLIPQLLKRQS